MATKQDDTTLDLPPVNSDFYNILEHLPPEERAVFQQMRDFLEQEVSPIANEYWLRDEFPMHLIPKLGAMGIVGASFKGYGCLGMSFLLECAITMEQARVDASFQTFYGVQVGLAMASIYHCGSEEQRNEWLPPMQRMELIGAFGLTEPEVGSGTARGMMTTCRREGDVWVLNGAKKWIGNATFADVIVVWARDETTNQVKGFLVRRGTPGLETKKIEGKIAFRSVQNGYVYLTNCRIAESDRLQNAESFAAPAHVLRLARAAVAWSSVGCAMGAYENALRYTRSRIQFGKPIANFQLVQHHLVQMLANITASQAMCLLVAQMELAGTMKDEHASLAKMFCTAKMRETVSWAREVLGGNGILVEHNVARFFSDAEAIYSVEGTYEMNTLIVGRAITGMSAFV